MKTTGQRNGRMNKKSTFSAPRLLLGVLAILSASSFLLFIRRDPKIELNPYQALGTVAAEETIKLMGDKGQIVVAAQDSREFEMPALAAQLKAFQATVRKKAKATVEVEKITMDAMTMMAAGGRLPAEQFFSILQKHPQAGAIVLFLGFPMLRDRDLDALKQRSPKMVVVAGYRADYHELLERRLIDLVIAPRSDALPETARKPQTLREWFDQEYVIIAAEKTSALPR